MRTLSLDSLSRDLVLPLWKSNVSVTLMIDKKAKRSVFHWKPARLRTAHLAVT